MDFTFSLGIGQGNNLKNSAQSSSKWKPSETNLNYLKISIERKKWKSKKEGKFGFQNICHMRK